MSCSGLDGSGMEGLYKMQSQSSPGDKDRFEVGQGNHLSDQTGKPVGYVWIIFQETSNRVKVEQSNCGSLGEASKAIIFERKEMSIQSPLLDVDEKLLVPTPGLVRIFWSHQAQYHVQTLTSHT